MEEDNSFRYIKFYDLDQSKDNIDELFNINTESINNDNYYNHYLCIKCHKFPFIKFCKNRKDVRLTCSCFNNKKITIKKLYKILNINDSKANLFSETSSNIDNENHLICKKHQRKGKPHLL